MDKYFVVERPEKQTIPILVDVPHAGEWIPDEVLSEMAVGDQTLRRDLDLYVDEIWAKTATFGATLIRSCVSRYVVDLNRAGDDVAATTVRGAKRVMAPGYYHDRGVVWRTTTDGVPVMSSPMSREAFERRIAMFHTPYHAAIKAEIERIKAQFGYCIMVDGHSMPSMGRSGHSDPGARRADVVPGDVGGTACDPAITWAVERHFKSKGYSVAVNKPYQGGWITRSFGRPRDGVHAIQIELNRDLYMDETSFERRPIPMEKLAEACVALIPKLAELPDLKPDFA